MIVSHIWLERRRNSSDPEEQFAILATSLEEVPLRYRFQFVVSQEASNADCTELLRARIQILVQLGNLAPDISITNWTRHGRLYRRHCDILMPPGETLRVGLHTDDSAPAPSASGSKQVFLPDDFVRGHWELSLPAQRKPGALPQPQFDRPARILVTVLRRRMGRSLANAGAPHETWVLPLASGQAEHLIPPDRGIEAKVVDGGDVSIAPARRAAPDRKRARRRSR